MFRKAFYALAVVLCVSSVAMAVPTITVGEYSYEANSGQHSFYVTSSGASNELVSGTDLFLSTSGPGTLLIVGFDVINDASLIFHASNQGQSGYAGYEVPTTSPTALVSTAGTTQLDPNGNLALVTIDTTGVAAGDYIVSLTHPLAGDSDLPPFNAGLPENSTLLVGGVVHITPEPSTIVMGLFAVAGFGAMVIRRRRMARA